ncbi:alkaline phosphatase D family protein [Rhodococcus sp. BP-252]|uniref:alkaline phosphatase D family protein n=2 Tax=Rhodococcus TaxID=1827 RepID=UPI00143010DB|nr:MULTISPECIES: alkaline phosphatase D family protein [unclassified Rhodococcus (in: high G+C Gram-positive bacteria)]MBY6411524.1 alkaline phosphatase D family protein [Rhodococcus sp. BP-320]MBY6417906.1 alkaline phosphatase D family protein [Rhodococcus sp. BP-321]MBY6422193.1 alkaline phosphatase D family protein [Rhodococcus sp. BP-324]MBY6427704.1 alkaline phosphatase D family protein [Rhodococcus sp. BP-323]MBY6433077.1 alkaline phosphatase D family protein [Rhodococcus sp. BP-322]
MRDRQGVSRRGFLRSSSVAIAAAGAASAMPAVAYAQGTEFVPFQHGVASGDPTPDAVVLWTRVTPGPDATPGSGLGPATTVRWRVATDRELTMLVRSGTVVTDVASDHTVKIDVDGLSPATTYYYCFEIQTGEAAGTQSAVGTTRTAPSNDADLERVRFGVVSCSNWESGFFAAYRHLADRRDLDAIIHLGDYIYEYETGGFAGKNGVVRQHDPVHEIVSLDDYRIRHGQYKSDPDLMAAHLGVPWICTWDDHESANDAYDGGAQNHQPETEGPWAERKANSVQAYYEWMPVRTAGTPQNRHLYRRLRFGNLLELSMLDLRTYRSQQVLPFQGGDVDSPNRTITGKDQMEWLTEGIVSSPTRWKIVGNPVMITPVLLPPLESEAARGLTALLNIPEGGLPYNADPWDGYTADRARLLGAIADNGVTNTVFITGDIHSAWACDIPQDASRYFETGGVATELVVTSVTSANIDDLTKTPPHTLGRVAESALMTLNRHIRYVDLDSHGFGVFEVTPTGVQMDHWYLDAKEDPLTRVYWGAGFTVADGVARVEPAPMPVRAD